MGDRWVGLGADVGLVVGIILGVSIRLRKDINIGGGYYIGGKY